MEAPRSFAIGLLAVVAAAAGAVVAQTPQAVGTWAPLRDLAVPLSYGASVALTDGRMLIAGGTAEGDTPSDRVTIYDSVTDTLTPAGKLVVPRSAHTATLLRDGRVLIVGGVTDAGVISTDIERFDPATGASEIVGQLAEPRRGHVAAALLDGTVLIAGGATTDGVVLQSAAIFNPETNDVMPLPTGLQVARVNASATTLLDGRVLIAGGSNGSADLASAETFERYSQSFVTAATQMSVPREGHSAVMLPHNGGVLIAGGTSNGAPTAGTDLFLPAVFPDPFSYGEGEFAATAAMAAPRAAAVAGPTSVEGYTFAATAGAKDAEVYRFATIKTDKNDYPPGERAVITGSGWQPGEDVKLLFQEDPAVHDDYQLTLKADAQGNLYYDQWAPEEHDLNVRFYLTATDSRSRAQTTFTDGRLVVVGVSAVNSSASVTYKLFTQQDNCTGASGNPVSVSLAHGATQTIAGNLDNRQSLQVTAAGSAADGSPFTGWKYTYIGPSGQELALDWTAPTLCVSGKAGNGGTNTFTANYGSIALVDATISVTPYSVTYDGDPQTATGTATGTNGEDLSALLTLTATTHTDSGTYQDTWTFAGNTKYKSASGTVTNTITKAPTTVTVTCPASVEYNGAAQTLCSATVTGNGGLDQSLTVSYGNNTNAGTATASASYAESANHQASTGSKDFTITKAPTTVTVTCPASLEYNGAAQEPCTATVTGNGGLNQFLAVSYSDNTNAGTATASASYAESTNHQASTGSKDFIIAKAPVTVAVTCPASVVYSGQPQEPCSATASGPSLPEQPLTVSYSDNTNAGTATASASYAESANHQAGSGTKSFTIAKAPVTVAVTCPATVTYSGSAQEPCSASVTGAGGLNQSLAVSYSNNTNAGTATASGSYAESANHLASNGSTDFTIAKAPVTVTVTCPASVTYNGSVQTPCSATVVGAGWLNQALSVSYANNTNAGTATACASYAESANHLGNTGSKQFTIDRRTLTVTPDGGKTKLLGATFTAFTGTVTGLQGTDAGTATYASMGAPAAAPVGSYDITATFVFTSGSASNYDVTFGTAVKGLVVVYRWDGFLQPINDTAHDLSAMSKFKLGQTIPAKFVLKNAAGAVVQQVGSPEFSRTGYLGACDVNSIPEDVPAVPADVVPQYTWDGSQYHYNWSTKGLTAGLYRIFARLGDGTTQSVDICLTK